VKRLEAGTSEANALVRNDVRNENAASHSLEIPLARLAFGAIRFAMGFERDWRFPRRMQHARAGALSRASEGVAASADEIAGQRLRVAI